MTDVNADFAACESLLDEWFPPEEILYVAPDGVTTAVDAIVIAETGEEQERSGIMTRVRKRSVRIVKTALPVLNQHATFIISGVTWSIVRTSYDDGTYLVLDLVRNELIEQARPGYRRQI